MNTLADRVIGWFLRSIATAVLFAGVATLIAGLPLFTLLRSESAEIRQIASTLLQLGGVFLATGAAARYFLRPRSRLLHNEETTIANEQRPPLGGWLQAMAFVLVAAPLVLVIRLLPFLAECRQAYAFLEASGVWNNANQNMAGIVLIPIFGALTPPLLEVGTMTAFIGASAILFPMLCVRSSRLPRVYVVSLILVSGLALAGVRAAYAVNEIAAGLRPLIDTSANAAEAVELRQGLDRYTSAVGLPVLPLVVAWFAYAIWLPPLLSSPRARDTFASPVPKPAATPPTARDIAAITRPPNFPGF